MTSRPYAECQREIMNRFWLVLAIVLATGGYNTYQLSTICGQVAEIRVVQELQLNGKLKAKLKKCTSKVEWNKIALR